MKPLLILMLLAMNLSAEPDPPQPPSLRLSNRIPVVDQSLQIRLPAQSSTTSVTIREESTGATTVIPLNQKDDAPFVEWTPTKTGYYVAEADGNPSLRFPVVNRKLTFLVWPPLEKAESHLNHLASHVIVNQAAKHPEEVRFWQDRGSRVLGSTFTGTRQIDLREGREKGADRLLQAWDEAMTASEADGIYIDELGGYPDGPGLEKTEVAMDAAKRFRERHPDTPMFVAVAGAPLPEMCAGLRAAGATALLEAYEQWLREAFGTHRFHDYIDRRIQAARHTDLIYEHGKPQQALIFLGADGVHGGVTQRELEDHVRYIRTQAPEMAGIAFYASARSARWLKDTALREWMDTLCQRYFVNPVLELQSLSVGADLLQAGKPVEVQVRIGNIGGMRAEKVRITLHAQPLSGGAPEIVGTTVIPELEVARLEFVEKDLEQDHYRIQEVNGRKIPVFNTPTRYWSDRHTASFDWTPERPGLHRLYATLEPDDSCTVLNGFLQREIAVVGSADHRK